MNSQLKIEEVDVAALRLDVSNYRFPESQASELEALRYLYANHAVVDVASAIVRNGYVDNELPMVVIEDGRYIVLEGNRRTAAILGLLDPSLVPASEAKLNRLRKDYPLEADAIPTRIRAMVFPDRDAAASVLARLHIGDSKKPWSLDEQAKFVLAQLDDGATAQQLRERFPVIKSVARLVRMNSVREMLKTTEFGDSALRAYAASPNLAMSAFEYAYKNAEIRSLLGLEFARNGKLEARPSTPAQLRVLARLIRGFQTEELSTRQGFKKNSPELANLLRDLRTEAGERDDRDAAAPGDDENHNTSSTGNGEGDYSPNSGTSDPKPGTGSRGQNSPESKKYLDWSGINEAQLPVPLKHRVRELRRIEVAELPAASVILMRTVLEAVIKEHYTLTGPPEVTGALSDVMERVTSDYGNERLLSNAIGMVNRVKNRDHAVVGTGAWFNFVTHSVNVTVKADHVHDAWRTISPLVRFLLAHSPAPDPVA